MNSHTPAGVTEPAVSPHSAGGPLGQELGPPSLCPQNLPLCLAHRGHAIDVSGMTHEDLSGFT